MENGKEEGYLSNRPDTKKMIEIHFPSQSRKCSLISLPGGQCQLAWMSEKPAHINTISVWQETSDFASA